jgi:anaerobic selenocysteine-containing dehydrogenase
VEWLINARRAGTIALLVVQGVVMTPLAEAADILLPGATYVEKDAAYTNGQGRVQAASRVIPPPGDAMEDWQILVNVAISLGAADADRAYTRPAHVRADLAASLQGNPAYAGITEIAFSRPVPARHWFQTSNPSERWKWDFMFQDLPPVKLAGRPEPTTRPDVIPLRRVE